MAIRRIVKEGDPILRMKCRPVTEFGEKLNQLLDDMHETLEQANGVGLAAPQVTYVMQTLKEKGFDVDVHAITIEEAKQSILHAFGMEDRRVTHD